ncbi:MAG: Pr6Pr family membrane protein [Mycobacteriales bacterium]
MTRQRIARALFAVTALAVLVGLIVQVQVSAGLKGTQFTSTSSLVFNVFCYFTVQSNIIVGATAALLAVRLDHPSTVFRVFRLAGLIAIAITFVVFHLALAHLQDLRGAAAFADGLLHTVVPVLAVSGWLVFGPRRAISWRIAALAVLFPLCWVAFALVRGALIDFYAYPFIDVRVLGYARVLGNVVLIGLLFFALAAVALTLDRRLPQVAPARSRVATSR